MERCEELSGRRLRDDECRQKDGCADRKDLLGSCENVKGAHGQQMDLPKFTAPDIFPRSLMWLRYPTLRHRGSSMTMPNPLLRLLLIVAILPSWCGNAVAQIQRIVPQDTTIGNYFGTVVAMDAGRVLVGASGVPSCGENAGAAFIYEAAIDGRYELVATLAPENCKSGRFFGHVGALSGDVAVVGGTKGFLGGTVSNPIYVFERDDVGAWSESAQLLPDNEDHALGFGASIALQENRLVVTALGDAAAGIPGAAFVFERSAGGAWEQTERIERDGSFGAVAVLDRNRLAVTAPSLGMNVDGGIYLFEIDATRRWQEIGRIGGITEASIRCDLDGDRLVIGRSGSERRQRGRVDIYERLRSGNWDLATSVSPLSSYDFGAFGTNVEIDGSRLLIVGYTEQINLPYNIDRVVYVFRRTGNRWRQQHIIDVGTTGFGIAIDLENRTAVIGDAGDSNVGSAYVVQLF